MAKQTSFSNTMNPKVDFYFQKESPWKNEIQKLRNLVLACNLVEELKWGCPCYSYKEDKIVLIHVFKSYCALLFFKGSLLKNEKNLLVQQTENVQAARQIRLTSLQQIVDLEKEIKATIFEAIEVEKAGLKVEFKKTSEFNLPKELLEQFEANPKLKKCFDELSPGRQRAYILYFSSAKQEQTRVARVKKYIPQILKGKGIDD
jgi:uncharacterized protein YdeI (YjbR/CyaY-like superfamily)